MRNINKIKELKDDRYTFSLDNKQIASIIISTISLGIVLFSTGYFIGKEGANKKTINSEIKTKNIAIINTNSKDEALTRPKVNTKGEAVTRPKVNNTKDKASGQPSQEKNIKSTTQKEVNKSADQNSKDKAMHYPTKSTNGEKNKKEDKITINTPKLPKKLNNNKGTGDKPFKTILKSNENGKYILQILATPKKKEANELKNRLIESGYKAFIEQVDSNGVLYNRVRIGFFRNSEEAKLFKNSFEKESGIKKTFITIRK